MRPIDRIKLDFDFDSLLAADGYHLNTKRSVKENGDYSYKIFHKLGVDLKPIVTIQRGWGSSGDQVYLNLNDSSDRGSVIDYLQRHHNLSFKEIFSFVENFEGKHSLPVYSSGQSTNKISKVVYHVLETSPVKRSKFLHQRQLSSIVSCTLFNSSILGCLVEYTNEQTGLKKRFQALGIPLYNSRAQLQAYTLKSPSIGSLFTSARRGALWHSKIISGPVLITESAIDAMSHYLLHGREATYISSEGRFSPSYVDTLQSLITDLSQRQIHFANDNDLDGFLYDLQWLHHLHQLPFQASKYIIPNDPDPDFSAGLICLTSQDKKLHQILEIQFGDSRLCTKEKKYIRPETFQPVFKAICKIYDLNSCFQHKSTHKDYSDDLVAKSRSQTLTR